MSEHSASASESGVTAQGRTDDQHAGQDAEKTLLEQMGGISGLAYSAVPIVVFVVVSALTSLMPAIWSSIGAAVLIAVIRLVRKEPLQPAISGVLGVAVCSFIAYRSGEVRGFFLLGIWTSLVYGGVFLASVVVLMAFDDIGRITLLCLPVILAALVAGWFVVRRRIDTSVLDEVSG